MNNNNNKKKWYVIHVFSGSEEKIIKYIKSYIDSYKLNDFFGEIIIPKENIIEIKNGVKKKSERKFFPGYILINMEVNEKTIKIISKIKNILGFIKSGVNLSNISEIEVNKILDRMKISTDNPKPKIIFNLGETIRVKDGPFSDFNGIIEEVDYSKNKVKVSISIFGRHTPIYLNFNQIEKLL